MKESIKSETVSYIASLAHLDLSADEQSRMVRDLNSILGFIESLNELDTKDLTPLAQVSVGEAAADATLRADQLRTSLLHEAALQNSPLSGKDFFKVPKVIER